jgi:hypothetical protein
MARDYRRASLVFPLLLITCGLLVLYAQRHPEFDPWPLVRTYWPLLLVFVGLGKMFDYWQDRRLPARTQTLKQGATTDSLPRRSNVGATIGILASILLLGLLLFYGHGRVGARGFGAQVRHDVRSIDREGAKRVHGVVNMSAGDLTVAGDSAHLLDASFDYRESEGTPEIRYAVDGEQGRLNIDDRVSGTRVLIPGGNHTFWNLRFGDEVPLELEINMGAGQGVLRLREVPVTKLYLNLGAGRVEADLSGDRKEDLQAEIKGGVGEADIRLPRNIGVVVNASGGLGSIDAHGLKHDGGEYSNEAYGHTPRTIRLTVEGGIGRIRLTQEP